MKRVIVLESLAILGVIGVLGYLHWKLNKINNERIQKEARISQLENDLASAKFMLGSGEKTTQSELVLLKDKVGEIHNLIRNLEKKLHEQTKDFECLREKLQKVSHDKETLLEKLNTLKRKQTEWGDAARNASLVAKELKLHEKAIERIQESLLEDYNRLRKELILPSVQLNGPDTVGSGILVYSGPGKSGSRTESYVFTSYHVVRDIFSDIPSDKEKVVQVKVYTKKGNTVTYKADLVASNKTIDAALLKLRTNKTFENVAKIATMEDLRGVTIFTKVVAVGCPLGNDPIPTEGVITHLKNRIQGSEYWMINAPTYLGNSGGGVFLAESRKLIGIFSKIYTHGRYQPSIVPHMGLCTPLSKVIPWLEKTPYSFIVKNPKNERTSLRKIEASLTRKGGASMHRR